MIDLHTHILPGLDDGAQSVAEALEMARVALADGIHTVVATPHFGLEKGFAWEEVLAAVDTLQAALTEAGLGLRVLPGAELMISPELPQLLGRDGAYSLNGSRYVLIELPLQQYPIYTEQVLFELQLKGLMPILAHPERNTQIQSDLDTLGRMVQRGALVQLTTGSLLGHFGGRMRQTAETILTHRMGHIIASDAHSPQQRPPTLAEARLRAARIVGDDRATALVSTDPARVLADQLVPVAEPVLRRERWR
ncbi:MAG: hypothetical protein M1370_02820 [Bacteroidetes bacterium]|nr:hypothetical protein [Bacteroidota bacterium]